MFSAFPLDALCGMEYHKENNAAPAGFPSPLRGEEPAHLCGQAFGAFHFVLFSNGRLPQ